MATIPMKGRDRNQLCGCGSGLKSKKCHGDPALQQLSVNITKGIVQLFVIQRMYDKEKIDAKQTVEGVNNVVEQINNMLPECVSMEPCFVDECWKEEPVVDKLKQKEDEGGTLEDIQEGTHMCDCGRRLPVGMNCVKCSEKGSN